MINAETRHVFVGRLELLPLAALSPSLLRRTNHQQIDSELLL